MNKEENRLLCCPESIIPCVRRAAIFEQLLTLNGTCNTRVVIDQKDDDNLVLVGVSAMDWPGLSSVVLSELHHSGWNLDVLEGFAMKTDGPRRGFVITGIRDDDPERRTKFIADAGKMAELLERLAEGRAGTVSLLSRAAERLEKFEEVRTALESLYGDQQVPQSIFGKKGELVLFISSRSDEYLAERKPSDLAWIIKTNFQLVNYVRSSGGKAHFRIKNIETTREHLTGINIAGYERDLSFQNCVTALTHAWFGASIRHQRRYTTRDGIISIRIEMTGPTGLSATREEQTAIRKSLKNLLVARELEKLNRIHQYGGAEHYARALIPLLLKECESTEMSQVYIALVSLTTFQAQLKVVIVTNQSDDKAHDTKVIKFIGLVNAMEGLTVASIRSPSHYGNAWVDIISITAEREAFKETEDAYKDIKHAMEDSFGEFRDFDRGMRLNDVMQLNEIRERLKEIPYNIITDFYYRIEDFLRASISAEELALHIQLIYGAIISYLEGKELPGYITSQDVFVGKRKIASLICCITKNSSVSFQHLLEAVKNYTVNVSIIDWSGVSAMFFRIQKDEHGLDEEPLSEVLDRLKALCETGHEVSS